MFNNLKDSRRLDVDRILFCSTVDGFINDAFTFAYAAKWNMQSGLTFFNT